MGEPAPKPYVSPMIEVFRKNEVGQWVLVAEAGPGQQATLGSVGCTLAVDEVYADPLAEAADAG